MKTISAELLPTVKFLTYENVHFVLRLEMQQLMALDGRQPFFKAHNSLYMLSLSLTVLLHNCAINSCCFSFAVSSLSLIPSTLVLVWV